MDFLLDNKQEEPLDQLVNQVTGFSLKLFKVEHIMHSITLIEFVM